jgi:hypothetical protein
MIEGLVAGLAIGIVVGLLIARLRQAEDSWGSRLTAGRSSSAPSPGAVERDAVATTHAGIVKRRVEARLTPKAMSIMVDGKPVDRLEDIPDPALRREVRELLASTEDSIKDPAERARLEEALRGEDPGPERD